MTDDPSEPRTASGAASASETAAGAEDEHTVTTGVAQRRESTGLLLEPAAVLDARYQIEAVIGEGGSGRVFRAWDRVLGEPVAVKILHPERAAEMSWIKRLAREVKVARAIRHPNVCRVFDLGHADGHWFVTMELAAGGNLRALLRQKDDGAGDAGDDSAKAGGADKTLRPLAERLVDARALCAGMAAIHAVGIVHRDVTPQNVLRMTDGRLVISDFGLAIENDANTTVHGGTPAYMPPEAVMGGRSDLRSDVWQLGAILHELLFGTRPQWTRTDGEVSMTWPRAGDASPVEEELARLCQDCLAPDPALRPPTAVAVVGRLAAAETARPRSWSSRLWLRARGVYRRHPRLRLAVLAAVVAAVASRAVLLMGRPSLCKGGADRVAGIWDPRTKALARHAFMTTRKPYAADAFWSVNRFVESYLQSWVGMYTEACEATHARGEQSSEVLDLRMSCLQERLSGVKALSQIFTKADGDVVGNAVTAAGSMPLLDRCGDVKLLRSLVQPPGDVKVRARVESARQRIAEIKATRDAGRLTEALKMAAALVAEAARIDYAPVQAETEAIQGELETVGDPRRAESLLQQAFFLAEAARDDDLKAETSAYLIEAVGYHQGRYDDAERWIQQTRATLRRMGGHERLQVWVENNVAILYHVQGRYPEAVAAYQRASALAEASLRADDPDVARPLGNLAMALAEAGRPAEGLGYNQRAVDILRKALGAGHPEVAMHISNRGEILNALGRYEEARALFNAAVAVWTKEELPPDHPYFGDSLNGIGLSYLGQGAADRALGPLEKALTIREKSGAEPPQIGETRFLLARALWDSSHDRVRAEGLARAAKVAYGDRSPWHRKVEAIDSWLERHRLAAAATPSSGPGGSAALPGAGRTRAVAARH